MVEFLADLLLALEALDQNRIRLHLGERNLDGHLSAGIQVGRPVEHRHAAVGDGGIDAVVVERVSGFVGGHLARCQVSIPPIVSCRSTKNS